MMMKKDKYLLETSLKRQTELDQLFTVMPFGRLRAIFFEAQQAVVTFGEAIRRKMLRLMCRSFS